MPNNYFSFRQFTVHQDKAAMKVCTDACLFGAWIASEITRKKVQRILDIGAGTGLLSLMVAQVSDAIIDAVEIDSNAYLQASQNFAGSPWNERMKVHHCAVQEFKPAYVYDVVISNPPFYDNDLLSPDDKKNLAMHSTQLSTNELFDSIKRLIKIGGEIAMLVPYQKVEVTERKIRESNLFIDKKVEVKQSEKHTPFRCMYLIKDVFSYPSERKITVKDDEFNTLLKNYYL
ncbi:MAG TPA: methyltransferase [Flavitalea sp.]|nr:methyltransferase [Flavitalea sp.]